MTRFVHHLRNSIARAQAEHAASADELAAGNLRRVFWLAVAMLALASVHALVFLTPAPAEPPPVQAWRHTLVLVHAGMAAVSALLGAAAWVLRRRQAESSQASRLCAASAFAVALTFCVLLTAADQRVTPNITPYLMGCALTGLLILQRPLSNAALHLAALAVLLWLLGLTQPDPQLLLSNRVNAASAAVLGWLLAVMSWRTTTQNLALTRLLRQRQQELERQQGELEHLVSHDGLTGLVNRAELERLCRIELLRAQRHGLPVSLLAIDLDHFKHVNDQWGHPVGDAVLVAVADVLRRSVRASDVVGRMGGEEFMVLLPHSDAQAAAALADKLRRAIAAMQVPVGVDRVRLTASVGVASARPGQELSFESLYRLADRALYQAKAAGRDRVELA
jgi:diguanylate cyclase (GGDEF)-like protein